MSAGYAIFNINVTNPENYKNYIEQVEPVAEKFGAEYIVRGEVCHRTGRAQDIQQVDALMR